jgi:hypothetical protein
MTHPNKLILTFLFVLLFSCSNNDRANNSTNSSNKSEVQVYTNEINSDEESNSDETECKFEDGIHSATVDYTNPKTGYSQTYTLDVEIENCEVVQINFPRGGWLDSDHISPSEIDEYGSCSIEGEDGQTYDIQIDN